MEKESFRYPSASSPDDVIYGIEYERDEHNKDRGLETEKGCKKIGGEQPILHGDSVEEVPEQKNDRYGQDHDNKADGIDQGIESVSKEAAFFRDSVYGL